MKNFILLVMTAFLTATGMSAQTYTSGTVTFFAANYSGKIDVTSSTVTLTLIGPSTSWLGMGFNSTGMGDTGMDCVIFDGTNMTDRTLDGVGVVPPLDAVQNWTVTSNVINTGVRTVVATRARDTGDANDYVFPAAAQPIDVIYARRTGSLAIGYHGAGSCGATTVNLTLGTESFIADAFRMYPNPSKGYLTVELPKQVNSGEIKIYDDLGRVVKKQTVSVSENKIETSELTAGTYIVVLRTEYGNATKNLVID
jgi:hypothetical protein